MACSNTEPDYNYFECEHVKSWHISLSIILLILSVIVGIAVFLTSIIVYNYSYFNSIRFRCPKSIITWGILTEIYLISRLLYVGILFKWWSFSIELDIFTYTIRGLGLNGGILIYVVRAWQYYITYLYDQDLLNNRISTNKSWLFSNKRYKNTIANENWLLKTVNFINIFLTGILAYCRSIEYDFFANIYYGISFFSVIAILILVFKFAHDQLGIRIEYATFFIVYIFGFIGTISITASLQDTSRRVLSWMGGLILLFAGNAFTFYFPFIRGGLLKIIRNGDDHQNYTKEQQFENHKELALILSNKRTYEAFRTFLASIFCVENIDFFVVVSQYRHALKMRELNKFQDDQNGHNGHNEEKATSMFESVLTPIAKKLFSARNGAMSISKSKSAVSVLPKNEDHPSFPNIQTRDGQLSMTETVDINDENRYKFKLTEPDDEELKNGYIGIKASSISSATEQISEPPNMDIMDIINNGNAKSRTPTLSSIIPKDINKKDIILNDDNFRLETGSISNQDDLVILDHDNDKDNDINNKDKENLAIHIDKGIKKVVKSSIGMLNDLKKQKKPEDMIQNLIIDKDGKKIIDPKSLDFDYLEYNDKLKELDINKWPNWIYNQYISRKSDCVPINIAYSTRLAIQEYFESHSYDINIFDSASDEVWKLMANDSLTHFKRTKQYKQIRSYFQTVNPDVIATPRFQIGTSSTKNDDDDDD